MKNKKTKVNIWKRVLSVVLALILMTAGTVIGQEDNSITANAGGSPVVFKEGDSRNIKVGKYQLIQESGSSIRGFKIKVQKGNKVLFSKKTNSAMLIGKKLYWVPVTGKYGIPMKRVYCYNIEKNKNTLVIDIDKEIANGYTDEFVEEKYDSYDKKWYYQNWYDDDASIDEMIAYKVPYLYYSYSGVGIRMLHRLNLKTKTTELIGCYDYNSMRGFPFYDMVYKGYMYCGYGDISDSFGPDVHDNKAYTRFSLNGKGKEKIIIKNCGNGHVVRQKDKLYYLQYKIRKKHTEKNQYKQTTYLKSCNLNGSNKKTLKTWKNQSMDLKGIIGNAIYLKKEETGTYYQYHIKSKKVSKIKRCAKVSNVKVEAVKGTNKARVTWNGMMTGIGYGDYEIAYATNPKFKGKKVIQYSGGSMLLQNSKSEIIKGLKKGQTYYVKVRIRLERSYDKFIYGPYSNAKKVTIR